MVRQDLVNYIKQYAAQGYTIDTLRNFLLQQGYPSQDVDEAIQAVKQKKLPLVKIGFVLGGGHHFAHYIITHIWPDERGPSRNRNASASS